MELWIRSLKSFASICRVSALSYDLPIDSVDLSAAGSVVVSGILEDYTDNWAVIAGHLYVISKSSAKAGKTTLSLALPEAAFSRALVYTGSGSETYGSFISATLQREWIAQPDDAYALPYLSVSNSDTTSFSFPVGNGEIYKFLDVLQSAAEVGIRLRFTTRHDGVAVAIAKEPTASHTVFTEDGHTTVRNCTVSRNVIAKVTVRQVQKTTRDGVTTRTLLGTGVYYWHPNGTVSTSPPSPRIPGSWTTVEIDEKQTLTEGAAKATAKNIASYKIEFWSDRVFSLRDDITIRIHSNTYRGAVAHKGIQFGRTQTLYRIGSLPTTLTEQLSALSKEV